jgi:hypothetical protein
LHTHFIPDFVGKDLDNLKFHVCKLERASPVQECQMIELPDLEFQQWMHFCVTFQMIPRPNDKAQQP